MEQLIHTVTVCKYLKTNKLNVYYPTCCRGNLHIKSSPLLICMENTARRIPVSHEAFIQLQKTHLPRLPNCLGAVRSHSELCKFVTSPQGHLKKTSSGQKVSVGFIIAGSGAVV